MFYFSLHWFVVFFLNFSRMKNLYDCSLEHWNEEFVVILAIVTLRQVPGVIPSAVSGTKLPHKTLEEEQSLGMPDRQLFVALY